VSWPSLESRIEEEVSAIAAEDGERARELADEIHARWSTRANDPETEPDSQRYLAIAQVLREVASLYGEAANLLRPFERAA
jgi:hypothetical protein